MYGAARKIENTTQPLVGAVMDSVEPIRHSLLGLSGAMKNLSNALGAILHGVVRFLNGLPFAPGLKVPPLSAFELPGLVLRLVGLLARLGARVAAGRRLLCGRHVPGALALL